MENATDKSETTAPQIAAAPPTLTYNASINKEFRGESAESGESGGSSESEGKLNLIIQYYNDSNENRQKELDFCVQANLENPHVSKVHNIIINNSVVIPEWLKNHAKYVQGTGKTNNDEKARMTYEDAFNYANEYCEKNGNGEKMTFMLCYLDIFLDHGCKWGETELFLNKDIVLCLSRHEFDGVDSAAKDEFLQRILFAHRQDAWVWKAPLRQIEESNFQIGRLGCDNAIAERFRRSKYFPYNSPDQFKIYHFDLVNRKKLLINRIRETNPERPELKGYLLVPDADAVTSIDHIMEALKFHPLAKYEICCDLMSKYIVVDNSPEKIKELADRIVQEMEKRENAN